MALLSCTTTTTRSSAAAPATPPGLSDPATTLPNGRTVAPAGQRVDLGDFPVGVAVSPDGRLAVAANAGQGMGLNAGFGSFCDGPGAADRCHQAPAAQVGDPATPAPDESLTAVDLLSGKASTVTAGPTSRDPGARRFNFFAAGLAFSPDGRHLFATGGGNDAVYDFAVRGTSLVSPPARTVYLHSDAVLSADGAPASGFDPPATGPAGEAKGLSITPDGGRLLVARELAGELDVLGPDLGLRQRLALGAPGTGYPYAVAVAPDGRRAWVSLQGSGQLAVVALDQPAAVVTMVAVGDHPTGLAVTPDGGQVLVANANDDTVAVVDAASGVVVQRLGVQAVAGTPKGSVPDAVALDPGGRRAYVALAGDDAVAVLERQGAPGEAWTMSGLVPTGWYPTAVAVRPSDGKLLAVSAKGLGSRYPPGGAYPVPGRGGPAAVPTSYYSVGNNMPGLLTVLAPPGPPELARGTAVVRAGLGAAAGTDARTPHNPVPARSGDPSPIHHVVYIVRENRTFDQVFGDLGRTRRGVDADPALELLAAATPSAHALAGRYALSDAFFSDGEASVQGHWWSSSANTDDYVEKSWRQYYSARHHPDDSLVTVAQPPGCSLFQAAAARRSATAGAFSWKDYGEPVGVANPDATHGLNGSSPRPGQRSACTPVGGADVDLSYLDGFTLDNRIDAVRFLADVGLDDGGRQVGDPTTHFLRNFSYLVLPGDHTTGLAGTSTPRAEVARNDAALGMIVSALSKSAYWPDTAVFVVEDDSQDGPDHVDGHRNILLVASPYARQVAEDGTPGFVGHRRHDQAGVLRTIELVLGLGPLSAYDAGAAPLYEMFADVDTPNRLLPSALAPFEAAAPPSFVDESVASLGGPRAAALRARSARLDLADIDRAGPDLEAVLWESLRPDPLPAELGRRRAGSSSAPG